MERHLHLMGVGSVPTIANSQGNGSGAVLLPIFLLLVGALLAAGAVVPTGLAAAGFPAPSHETSPPLHGQDVLLCPTRANPLVEEGWAAFRAGDLDDAFHRFQEALESCPEHADALTGAGYVFLREGKEGPARERLQQVVDLESEHVDALVGLGILAWRAGDLEEVDRRFRQVLELSPGHPEAEEFLGRLPAGMGPAPERAELVLPDTVEVRFRAQGDHLEVLGHEGWAPFYVKGMNLGAALPGHFPGEFPQDSAIYRRWIQQMGQMGVNAIRVYTIHPPAFYEELAAYNRSHPQAPILLLHGVWTELPPDHDYLDDAWEGAFFQEMRRVVDLLHGRADIAPRPGHASGHYTEDVSPWVLGYILGREWEPYSVDRFNEMYPEMGAFQGEYVVMSAGSPMDGWLARAVEELVAYETRTYRVQRPVAYTTWPTLDPLHHPTEATAQEEENIRRALGDPELIPIREYDNDGPAVDPSLHRPTERFAAGVFAAYHAYPYYPDFMILEESFAQATSTFGPSRYLGYLTALKDHHREIPVIIAEYGLPASLGNSHIQPEGLHHGGLTEAEHAAGNHRLTLEIAEAGMGGGIFFAWIDEWFKLNWPVLEFEYPAEHRVRWLNRLNSEQHYGVIAKDPAPPVKGATLQDRTEGWEAIPFLSQTGDGGRGMATLRGEVDEGHLWFHVMPGTSGVEEIFLGFDLAGPEVGEFRWPGGLGPRLPAGAEFVLHATRDTVRVLAHPTQALFRFREVGPDVPGTLLEWEPEPGALPPGFFTFRGEQEFNLPFRSEATEDGVYAPLRMIMNRRRFTRDSVEVLAVGYDRGILPRGDTPDGYWEWTDGGALEVRIPWNLLNVTDPSTRTILQGSAGAQGLQFQQVDGIGVMVAYRNPDGGWVTLPGDGDEVPVLAWEEWTEPQWEARKRPVFDALARAFQEIPSFARTSASSPGVDEVSRSVGDTSAGDVGWSSAAPGRVGDENGSGPDHGAGNRNGDGDGSGHGDGDHERDGASIVRAGWDLSVPAPDTLTIRERANQAWIHGGDDDPEELYRLVLEDEPDDQVALLRLGLLLAWEDQFEQSLALLDRLIGLEPENVEALTHRARVLAWSGELERALAELEQVLALEPAYVLALEARAQFLEWTGDYRASASAYGRLLEVGGQENLELHRSRARLLVSAGEVEEARAAWDSVLAADPNDVDARLSLARLLALAGMTREAVHHYEEALARAPDRVDAWMGLGRALSWGGRLPEGEEAWREAVSLSPGDADARAGLVQNLRWQGRAQAGREVASEVGEPIPGVLREQLRWVDAALNPALDGAVIFEVDSDDHEALTLLLNGRVPLRPRLTLHMEMYRRELSLPGLSAHATGGMLSAEAFLEPGWRIRLGGGGAQGSLDEATRHRLLIQASSPARHPLVATVRANRSPVDVTARLVETVVEATETAVDLSWGFRPGWRLAGGAGWARFQGTEENDRWNASARLGWTGGPWSAGLSARAFGFDRTLADGYFSPDFFGLAELPLGWRTDGERWGVGLEGAPGVQKIGDDGELAGVIRGNLRLARRWGPGRELGLSAAGSTAGLERMGADLGDGYRYRAFRLDARWVF
jgi:tetratricopeptide (TPR) repeat protein